MVALAILVFLIYRYVGNFLRIFFFVKLYSFLQLEKYGRNWTKSIGGLMKLSLNF
jgi:hypothetical protein